MKLEVFEELISTLEKCEAQSFAAHQLGIDLIEYDTPFTHATWLVIRAHYGKEASEWIEWYLYERKSLSGELYKAFDKDGNEICNTVESLWQIVEELRTSSDFIEYSLPIKEEFDPEKFKQAMENMFFNKNEKNED
jgi:hypothetical protein